MYFWKYWGIFVFQIKENLFENLRGSHTSQFSQGSSRADVFLHSFFEKGNKPLFVLLLSPEGNSKVVLTGSTFQYFHFMSHWWTEISFPDNCRQSAYSEMSNTLSEWICEINPNGVQLICLFSYYIIWERKLMAQKIAWNPITLKTAQIRRHRCIQPKPHGLMV